MTWLVDTVTYYVIHTIEDIWQDTRERKERKELDAGVVTSALHGLRVGSFQSPCKDCAGNGVCVFGSGIARPHRKPSSRSSLMTVLQFLEAPRNSLLNVSKLSKNN